MQQHPRTAEFSRLQHKTLFKKKGMKADKVQRAAKADQGMPTKNSKKVASVKSHSKKRSKPENNENDSGATNRTSSKKNRAGDKEKKRHLNTITRDEDTTDVFFNIGEEDFVDTKAQKKTTKQSSSRVSTTDLVAQTQGLLANLKESSKYQDIIKRKDVAYANLESKYEQLKQDLKEQNQKVLKISKSQSTGGESDDRIKFWKAEASSATEKLKVNVVELNAEKKAHLALQKQVKQLSAADAKLQDRLQECEDKLEVQTATIENQIKIEEAYILLTATQVQMTENGRIKCKTVNRAPYREMAFTLIDDGDKIQYKPRKIDLSGKPNIPITLISLTTPIVQRV